MRYTPSAIAQAASRPTAAARRHPASNRHDQPATPKTGPPTTAALPHSSSELVEAP